MISHNCLSKLNNYGHDGTSGSHVHSSISRFCHRTFIVGATLFLRTSSATYDGDRIEEGIGKVKGGVASELVLAGVIGALED